MEHVSMKRRLTESERFVVDVWKRIQKTMLKHDDEIQQGATRKTTKPKKDKKILRKITFRFAFRRS